MSFENPFGPGPFPFGPRPGPRPGPEPITTYNSDPYSFATMDIQTLMMVVQSKRAETLETQLKDQATAMQNQSAKIADANEMLRIARSCQAKECSKTAHAKLEAWRKKHNVPFKDSDHDETYSSKEWDYNIESVKNYTDTLNSSSQMDMIRFQGLMNKRNQAYDTMASVNQKIFGLDDKIISKY